MKDELVAAVDILQSNVGGLVQLGASTAGSAASADERHPHGAVDARADGIEQRTGEDRRQPGLEAFPARARGSGDEARSSESYLTTAERLTPVWVVIESPSASKAGGGARSASATISVAGSLLHLRLKCAAFPSVEEVWNLRRAQPALIEILLHRASLVV